MTTVTVVRQAALAVLLLQPTVHCQRDNRATVTNRRKVLSEEGKSVMRQIGTGNKEAGICGEFGLGNCTIQKIWEKAQPKLVVRLKRTDRGYSDFESPNEVTSERRC
jgi:hypothetical protein